jgi:Predicted integral membrane protein (DUF2269)
MSVYTLALFAHLLGVLRLFIGMGLQWTITLRLRRARTVAQVREWSSLIGGVGKLGVASGALLLVAGIYMTAIAWSMTTPWIVVSLAAMLFMIVLGMGVTTRRLKAVQRMAAMAEARAAAIPPELRRQIDDPLLWISAQLAGGTALGIVVLMTNKPGLGGSLFALAVALVLGGVVGGVSVKRRRNPRATQSVSIPLEEASLR